MTLSTEQLILNKLDNLQDQINQLLRTKKLKDAEWLNEKEAAGVLGIHPSTLRRYRCEGRITDFRVRETGHGIQYNRKALEKLFITTKL